MRYADVHWHAKTRPVLDSSTEGAVVGEVVIAFRQAHCDPVRRKARFYLTEDLKKNWCKGAFEISPDDVPNRIRQFDLWVDGKCVATGKVRSILVDPKDDEGTTIVRNPELPKPKKGLLDRLLGGTK